MAVISKSEVGSSVGLGVIGLGSVAVALMLRRRSMRQAGKAQDGKATTGNAMEDAGWAMNGTEHGQPVSSEGTPKIKSRVGNFKISKLSRLVLGVAEGLGAEYEFDWDKTRGLREGKEAPTVENGIHTNNETEWEAQVNRESQMFLEAARILHEVKKSATHKKLQHFYVVDRQLTQLEEQFREISEEVLEFPWREHRDDPMSDLVKLPFMKLAAEGGGQALLPVSQGFVKQTAVRLGAESSKPGSMPEDRAPEDEALLGVGAGADRQTLESAFRHKARDMHQQGHCVKLGAFHALNNAYERCLARLVDSGWLRAYAGGGDILAHYLLIGTDPSESRYGEAACGLLDALQRERLLMRLDVLRSWGEVSGSTTGLGQG